MTTVPSDHLYIYFDNYRIVNRNHYSIHKYRSFSCFSYQLTFGVAFRSCNHPNPTKLAVTPPVHIFLYQYKAELWVSNTIIHELRFIEFQNYIIALTSVILIDIELPCSLFRRGIVICFIIQTRIQMLGVILTVFKRLYSPAIFKCRVAVLGNIQPNTTFNWGRFYSFLMLRRYILSILSSLNNRYDTCPFLLLKSRLTRSQLGFYQLFFPLVLERKHDRTACISSQVILARNTRERQVAT